LLGVLTMKYIGLIILLTLLLAGCQSTTPAYIADDIVHEPEPERFTQLEPTQPGEPIATVHTSKGDIVIRLFPQYAPMAVENFTTMAERGRFDGVLFYRAVPQFVIQGGIHGDRTTIWSSQFGPEIDTPLYHIRGAVGAAGDAAGSVSNFYIVQNNDMDYGFDYENRMSGPFREMIANPHHSWIDNYGIPWSPQERPPVPFLQHYLDYGGMWRLDYPSFGVMPQRLTVFGQVIYGMAVVDAIANVETTGPEEVQGGIPLNTPLVDIVILTITLGEYAPATP